MARVPYLGEKLTKNHREDVPVEARPPLLARVAEGRDGEAVLVLHHPLHGVLARAALADRSESALLDALDVALAKADAAADDARRRLVDELASVALNDAKAAAMVRRADADLRSHGDRARFEAALAAGPVARAVKLLNDYRAANREAPVDLARDPEAARLLAAALAEVGAAGAPKQNGAAPVPPPPAARRR